MLCELAAVVAPDRGVGRRCGDQAQDHRERQDHLAVLGLLVVAPEEIGDRPNEGRVIADHLVIANDDASLLGHLNKSPALTAFPRFLTSLRIERDPHENPDERDP